MGLQFISIIHGSLTFSILSSVEENCLCLSQSRAPPPIHGHGYKKREPTAFGGSRPIFTGYSRPIFTGYIIAQSLCLCLFLSVYSCRLASLGISTFVKYEMNIHALSVSERSRRLHTVPFFIRLLLIAACQPVLLLPGFCPAPSMHDP